MLDSDNDGVNDVDDRRPGSTSGEQVDANGCSPDSDGDGDGDGVPDYRDDCPDTTPGRNVNQYGCVDDEDGDAVFDLIDQCPSTPAGTFVDARGCGPDNDKDGIPNHRDSCPSIFPPALVDDQGCYEMLEETVRITLDVEFNFDSAKSRPEHTIEVKKVADFLAQYPRTDVTLEGRTDSIGAARYNKGLSERRAATMAGMLVEQFNISAGRVGSIGLGEDKPIADNLTAAGQQKNRREVAEIVAVSKLHRHL
jgi:OOP family OmpA-OmpF porin